ncbi:hypothetical protein MWU65_01570 [Cellulophaga sp. F20128]|uniref:hypothetical protein n=1 Tax=Cellulophaga sp. F20128 TaxID=2926413 RepID=UPI001FF6F5DD|nr:hypothetical protein [Cellulophaga sp. F20128]MCK0155847.1 hypothetical protein [Cellulophaga sp. F20128]
MRNICIAVFFIMASFANAQLNSGVFLSEEKQGNVSLVHELKIDDTYFVATVYQKNPAKFIKTQGGFYTVEGNQLRVKLEFNSNFQEDGVKELVYSFIQNKKELKLEADTVKSYTKSNESPIDLNGKWLITGRGDQSFDKAEVFKKPRKTMKFLYNGHFQWIAFNSDTFQFSGTGGGTYEAKNGTYIEKIAYFSRDDSRVGAALDFKYEIKNGDWHHSGKSSKGADIYEVWSIRE